MQGHLKKDLEESSCEVRSPYFQRHYLYYYVTTSTIMSLTMMLLTLSVTSTHLSLYQISTHFYYVPNLSYYITTPLRPLSLFCDNCLMTSLTFACLLVAWLFCSPIHYPYQTHQALSRSSWEKLLHTTPNPTKYTSPCHSCRNEHDNEHSNEHSNSD